jgi:hypothetical protein
MAALSLSMMGLGMPMGAITPVQGGHQNPVGQPSRWRAGWKIHKSVGTHSRPAI